MVNLFVIALLYAGTDILFLHRYNTGFGDGQYGLVGGKVEPGETALKAIKREVSEETALDIAESAFELVHVLHRKGTETEFIALFFKADISTMHLPKNNEPDKHDEVRFFDIGQLPDNVLPAHKQALQCIQKNRFYSEHGW